MKGRKKYRLNPVTLLYEIDREPKRIRFRKGLLLLVGNLALSCLYVWIYTSVLHRELPKTVVLKKKNTEWRSRIELMGKRLDQYQSRLETLEDRDENVYRNIFGMNTISSEVRDAGFGGVNRYAYLDDFTDNSMLKQTSMRLDILTKKAYVQSRSFDEIGGVSRRAGDIASCVPAISPILPDKSKYRLSSSFGYRSDPISGRLSRHTGMDFAMKPGNPVYSTGDGVVESASIDLFGYGQSVMIDHGFGYKTRYAHLSSIYVAEGMKVRRGECIGESGNSGKSTGPHLHYEVLYKGAAVNPYNYVDLDADLGEYREMVERVEASLGGRVLKPHTRVKVK